ncbi:MAG: 4Fe-4S dicluster domain-containing protein [Chloroflexi bacterium]|nr:4Fe-4S dicluster domain-containing protein [Chloroflexota bacterium]
MNESMPQQAPVVETRNPQPHLVFDPSWCRACKVCEMACSSLKEGQARPAVARINVFFDEFAEDAPISAMLCFHCADAPCLAACPTEAMSRHPITGAVLIDEAKCVGCMLCRRACPWDVPKRHPDRRVAIKCDLCSDRAAGPYCVQVCPLSGRALRHEPGSNGESQPEIITRRKTGKREV